MRGPTKTWVPVFAYILSATTILIAPSGMSSALDQRRVPSPVALARASESNAGVDLSERSPTVLVTMLMPVGLDPYCKLTGNPASGCGGEYRDLSGPIVLGHLLSPNVAQIICAKAQQSEQASAYKTSTEGAGVISTSEFLKDSKSKNLGLASFCKANWAWAARSFATAVSFFNPSAWVESSAMRSLAFATSAAASALYCACSIADCSISTLCNLTTNHVERPAISPDTPTTRSETRIKSSQPWSERPQIIFTLFERVVADIVLFSAYECISDGDPARPTRPRRPSRPDAWRGRSP
jgi:hypothetical protein